MPARHKQTTPIVVRARRLGIPAMTLLAVGSVAAVAFGGSATEERHGVSAGAAAAAWPVLTVDAPPRQDDPPVSRSAQRPAPLPAVPRGGTASGRLSIDVQPRWPSVDLNVWSGPGEHTRLLLVLEQDVRVGATGLVQGEWAQIVQDQQLVWVRAAYLAAHDPEEFESEVPVDAPEASAEEPPEESTEEPTQEATEEPTEEPTEEATEGDTSAPCPYGSDIESGLVPNAIAVYRSVCAAFPEVSAYGGLRPGDDGFHGSGQAVDAMIPDSAVGDAVAAYVLENASALGVSEILWAQQIWTADRSSEGWRPVEDRGSVTANHYDHVHVSVY